MILVGIDEVGRGCWAGPLVAGAVVLGDDFQLPAPKEWILTDSKAMTKAARHMANARIVEAAQAYGLGWVKPAEIDTVGLTAAVRLAMERALQAITMVTAYDEVIIDGSHNFLATNTKARTLVKADLIIPAVSAASIIAKVARDNYMIEQAQRFPGYGFEAHVGYGTAQHSAALQALGVCELHRKSYKPVQRHL